MTRSHTAVPSAQSIQSSTTPHASLLLWVLVDHTDTIADELAVPLRRPRRLVLTERDILAEVQKPPDMFDDCVRNLSELREIPELLVRLKSHDPDAW